MSQARIPARAVVRICGFTELMIGRMIIMGRATDLIIKTSRDLWLHAFA